MERALELLEALARADGDVSITALAARTGLHVSTAHRLLATLVARGWVAHDPKTRRYRAGERLAALGPGPEDRR